MAKKAVDQAESVELALVGPKSLLGCEDIVNGIPVYSTSIQCVTQEAEVLAITKEEFASICKGQGGTWSDLSAFLEHRIDNYVGTIYNKNLVNAEMVALTT